MQRGLKKYFINSSAIGATAFLVILVLGLFIFPSPRGEIITVPACTQPENDCRRNGLPYQDLSLRIDDRLNDLLGRMNNAEKIGQMALVEKDSLHSPADIAKYGLGALMSGGGNKPADPSLAGWQNMIGAFQTEAARTRWAIPILYGVDANHGHGNLPGATLFPHQIGIAAANDPKLAREVARAAAEEIVASGVSWVYSPDLDIAQDMRWGRVYETFGSNPERVTRLGTAYLQGLRSINDIRPLAVTAKHFLGNGATLWGSSISRNFSIDQGNTILSEDALRTHLEPFRIAVQAGADTVMVGLNKWNGEKVVFNNHLINGTLKSELGFNGFVVSDWYGVYEKENNKYNALVKAVNAGVDMVMLPYDYEMFSRDMQKAIANGDISQERLDEAARRILKVKFVIGLFDKEPMGSDSLIIPNSGHREIARRAVRQSLVVLKDDGVLPLSKKTRRLYVAGSAADNIGRQSGGWSVEWQGFDGNGVSGTSILQGIEAALSPSTHIEYDEHGMFPESAERADIGIAVVGERPYAEGWGDNPHPELSREDLEAIARLKKRCAQVVVIIISGRPLDIARPAQAWDAVIAAWLPGSEGAGVADVLFGDFPFSGSLPVVWNLDTH